MLALMRQRLGSWLREQLRLDPALSHLDDGACRWHFGDDPQEGADLGGVD